MKKVQVNYPKKSTRLHIDDFGAATEPERKSMYQVMQENLKAFNRGDEDNLNKHLGLLLDESGHHYESLGVIKLLIHVSNINQRFLEDWIAYTGAPCKFHEKIDINADVQISGKWIYNCIKKLYSLIGTFGEYLLTTEGAGASTASKISLEASNTMVKSQEYSSKFHSSFSYNNPNSDPTGRSIYAKTREREFENFLPEYELLDFVINSSFTLFLQDYFQLYGIIPMRDIYKDKVWPVPHDFIPYDIFEKPYDCAIELPKNLSKPLQKELTLSPKLASSPVSNMGTDIDVHVDDTFSIQTLSINKLAS
ncbi:uncharacterized protein [Euwallacea fornicatus]|uniref:uncharacterized protein isoform X2 n=1 Tax=Euwallacea fornicatus TaxID=995702 RepID=UPI00338E262C